MTEPTTKKCSLCKADLPLDDFNRDAQKRDGRSSWCKPCTRDKEAAYKAAKAALAQPAASAPQTPTEAVSAPEKPKAKRTRKPRVRKTK